MPSVGSPSPIAEGRRRPWSNPLTRAAGNAAAPALVLLTPFVVFLKYHEYGYSRPEALVCLVAITVLSLGLGALASIRIPVKVFIIAAVLTFFVDVQFEFFVAGSKAKPLLATFVAFAWLFWVLRPHAERVLTLVAATALASTLLTPQAGAARAPAAEVADRADLPLIVHLVLDAHIGLDGLPADRMSSTLRSDLRGFFERRGFRVFGAAYSEHFHTWDSIGHLVNLSPGTFDGDLTRRTRPGFGYRLTQNRYFSMMAEKGYALKVYQAQILNLCADTSPAVTCRTYQSPALGALQGAPLRVSDKAQLIAGTYLDRSIAWKLLNPWYKRVRATLVSAHVRLPDLSRAFRAGPLNSVIESARVARELSRAGHGELFFAHFLLPHEPFVYDAECNLVPPDRWLGRDDGQTSLSSRSPAERTAGYVRYEGQLRCTLHVVDKILESIPDRLQRDAIVIVQRDHGSRMAVHSPFESAELSVADYADVYSTLFVVRAPGLEPEYDDRFVPITCIFKSLVENGFHSLTGLDACVPAPSVFTEDDRGNFVLRPLPAFARRDPVN